MVMTGGDFIKIAILSFIQSLFTFLIIVAPGCFFGYLGKTTEMGLAILAGSIATAFLNIDKIQSFKGAGFEAQMKKAVDEAVAKTEELKELSAIVVSTLFELLIGQFYMFGMQEENKDKQVQKLISFAEKIQIKDSHDIYASIQTIRRLRTWELYYRFIVFYNESDNPNVLTELNALRKEDSTDYPSESIIIETLNKNGISLTPKTKVLLEDYLYYIENNKRRHI